MWDHRQQYSQSKSKQYVLKSDKLYIAFTQLSGSKVVHLLNTYDIDRGMLTELHHKALQTICAATQANRHLNSAWDIPLRSLSNYLTMRHSGFIYIVKVWAWPVLFITVKQTVTFGTHCLSWRHIVWLSHKLSDSETSCPILRQADWSWNKPSKFETCYLVLSNYCTSCLVSGQTVQALDWLYCHASLWRSLRAACDPPQQTAKSILCVRVIFQELYAENISIYNLWTQLCT